MTRKFIKVSIVFVTLFSVSVFAGSGVVNTVQNAISYLNTSSSVLTQEEKDFLDEMAQIKAKLSLDELKNKKARLDYEKKNVEQHLAQLEIKINDPKEQDVQLLKEELEQTQQKLAIIARVESKYNQSMVIFEKVYQMTLRAEYLSSQLNSENINLIKALKKDYEAGHYPEQLLKIWGLDQIISIQNNKTIAFETSIIEKVWGIKSAYADTDPTGIAGSVVDIACPPVGVYDAAVGWTGQGLDLALWIITIGNYHENYCDTTASWMQVSSNVNRIVNACGLSDANHIVEKTTEIILNELTSCFNCSEEKGEKQVCGKCCKIEDKECVCEACGHGTWNEEDCDCEAGYKKFGDVCCLPQDEYCICNAQGKKWNWSRQVCCEKDDEQCLCYGELDNKLGCCENGKWDNGLCCEKGTYNSNGHCCPSEGNGFILSSSALVWDGKECVCPQGTKKIQNVCCKEGDAQCECEANLGRWDPKKKICCDSEDKKCICSIYGFDWDDKLGCCEKSKWDNGLCCYPSQYNSNGHCCHNGEEWSEHSSGIWPLNSIEGKCCPKGTFYDGEECVCAKNEEKTNGHCCPIGHIWFDEPKT